ncbi:unnamed protein product [marine sediment metagenome]|uniref:Uncharacterized protein n=1 Tax=marine sediment metagenome TaxID=412755 RepID=X1QTB3_9ZZZZ
MSKIAETKTGTWDQLKMHPAHLVKMVVDGKAKIIGKDRFGRYIYEVKYEQSNKG